MKKFNTLKLLLMIGTLVIFSTTINKQANAQYRQIRVSEYCEVIGKELRAKVNSSLYKSALEKKKAGTLNRKSRARLEDVEYWRDGMRRMKCKNIP